MASISSTGSGANILFSQTFLAADNTSFTITLSKIPESDKIPARPEEILESVANRVSIASSPVMNSSSSVSSTCSNSEVSSHVLTSILRSPNCMRSVERVKGPAKTVRFADNIPVNRDSSKIENVNLGIQGCEILILKDDDLNHYSPEAQIELRKINQKIKNLKNAFEKIKESLAEYSFKDIENYMNTLNLLIIEKQRYIDSIAVAKERGLEDTPEVQQSSHVSSSSDVHFRELAAARREIILKVIERIPNELTSQSFFAQNMVQEYNKERILFLKSTNATLHSIDETGSNDIIKIIIFADKLKKFHEQVSLLNVILKVIEQIPEVLDVDMFVGLAKWAVEEYNRKHTMFIEETDARIRRIITSKDVETIVDCAKKLENYREEVFKLNKQQLSLLGTVSYARPYIQAKTVRKADDKKAVENKENTTSKCDKQAKRRRNAITPDDSLFKLTEVEREKFERISELKNLKRDRKESKSKEGVRVHIAAGSCLRDSKSLNPRKEQISAVSLKYQTSREQEAPNSAASFPNLTEAE